MAVNETSESVKFDTRRGRLLKKQAQSEGIDDEAVTTAKVADDAITNPKIGSGAVDTPELADSAVTDQKVSDVSVPKLTSGNLAAEVRDSGANPIADSLGLVSTNTFNPNITGYLPADVLNGNSTTYAGIGSGQNLTFSNDRTVFVIFFWQAMIEVSNSAATAYIAFFEDGNNISPLALGTNNTSYVPITGIVLRNVTVGQHAYQLKYRITNGSYDVDIVSILWSYVILGK